MHSLKGCVATAMGMAVVVHSCRTGSERTVKCEREHIQSVHGHVSTFGYIRELVSSHTATPRRKLGSLSKRP